MVFAGVIYVCGVQCALGSYCTLSACIMLQHSRQIVLLPSLYCKKYSSVSETSEGGWVFFSLYLTKSVCINKGHS